MNPIVIAIIAAILFSGRRYPNLRNDDTEGRAAALAMLQDEKNIAVTEAIDLFQLVEQKLGADFVETSPK